MASDLTMWLSVQQKVRVGVRVLGLGYGYRVGHNRCVRTSCIASVSRYWIVHECACADIAHSNVRTFCRTNSHTPDLIPLQGGSEGLGSCPNLVSGVSIFASRSTIVLFRIRVLNRIFLLGRGLFLE